MAFLKRETNFVGIDIGTTGIRLVQARGDKPNAKLVTYGVTTLDTKVAQSDAEIDRQQIITVIKNLLEQSRSSARKVVSGLPSSKVFSTLVSLPNMSPQELEKAVRYQAEQHIPMALDQVKLDWMFAGQSPENNQQEVLIVAVPKTLAERQLGILEAAGLEVLALEPDALALARSLVRPEDKAVVVLDVGSNSTDLVTVHNGIPKLIRSIPIGGNSFIAAATQSLNLEPNQAQQFVYKFGLAQTKFEGQVFKAISSHVDSLVSELDKSIKFFTGRYKNVSVEKVILTGQASTIPEFPSYIANSVRLPVEIGNSWLHINSPVNLQQQLMQLSNQFAVACGLAIRGGSDG